MHELPKHLSDIREKARLRAELDYDGLSPDVRNRIPKHLLERSRARSAEPADTDPFEAKKEDLKTTAANLLSAKILLLLAIQPIRDELDNVATELSGQFINRGRLQFGANFTPVPSQPNTEVYLTLYGEKEAFTEVEGGRSLRIGEHSAWRMPVAKNKLGALLKSTGQRPIRDTIRIARDGSVFVDASDITTEVAAQAFEQSVAERRTNSITLFEGEPTRREYEASYGNRYAAGLSVTRNPSETPEEKALFGVDFTSLTGSFRVDEGRARDGSLFERERTVMEGFTSFNTKPSQNGLIKAFNATQLILTAFGNLLNEPTRTNTLPVYSEIDRRLR